MDQGMKLWQAGESERALLAIDEAIAADPTQAFGYYTRGSVLQGLKCFPEALQPYDRAIALTVWV